MDAEALGGVLIKKLLILLRPKSFEIDKDVALIETKGVMSRGRDYVESEVDGAIIEMNPDYGALRSYYIDELSEQMGSYHIEDKKLETDFVMTVVMGVSYISKKMPKHSTNKVEMNHLAGYNTQVHHDNSSSMRYPLHKH